MKIDRKKFFTSVRSSFGKLTQKQVDALEFLLGAFEADPRWKDVRHTAYALATIRHETANTYQPIMEYGNKAYFNQYDIAHNPRKAKMLGNTQKGDGYKYRGAGFVQITGRANFDKFGIADDPNKALEPATAFRILSEGMHRGLFTGKKLSDFIKGSTTDYKGARKIINGTDKNILIAGYATNFEKILRAAQSSAVPPVVQPSPLPDTNENKPATQPPIKIENIETVKLDNTPAPTTQTVVKERVPVWVKISGGVAALTGMGINIGTIIQSKLEAITPMQMLWVVIGLALLGLAVLFIERSAKRAHERTMMKMKAASDPGSNNLELSK